MATLHGSKGCQWDAVLIHQFADGLIPMSKGDEIEERNLAFVGLSRPRYHLTMTINRSAKISPFLMGMQLENTPWP
jgi:superfamily I DNA/RNA helicase